MKHYPKYIVCFTLLCLLQLPATGFAVELEQPTLDETSAPQKIEAVNKLSKEVVLPSICYTQSNALMSVLTQRNPNQFSKDYKTLEECRLQLISKMYELMYEISGNFTDLERVVNIEDQIAKLRVHNDNPEELKLLLNDLTSKITKLRDDKLIVGEHISKDNPDISEKIRDSLELKVQKILKYTDTLAQLGSRVSELNDTKYVEMDYKTTMSILFGGLVGLVIIGFFIVASKDPHVRKTIFSGDAGIQFLTLFSIVIAIILFGITGILEGKEISALIGGISGYILGRGSQKEDISTQINTDEKKAETADDLAAKIKTL